MPVKIAAEVLDFNPKEHVRPRKSLKVMSRDVQISYAAARLACQDAGVSTEVIDPERLGVVFGADMIYCELKELEDIFLACIEQGEFVPSRWGEMT